MARTIDVATGDALAAARRTGLVVRDFVWVVAKTSGGADAAFGFWSGPEDVTVAVIDAETGNSTSRLFYGGGSLVGVPSVPLKVGLSFETTTIQLNPLHSQVASMLRANNSRAARIDIYRGLLSTDTQLIVSQPRARFAGKIDIAEIMTPEQGGTAVVPIVCVPFRRELTRINTSRKSDEFQKSRSSDRWRRFESRKRDVEWGAYQEPEAKSGLLGLGWWFL